MKNLKKFFAVAIVVAMMATIMAPAFAAGAYSYDAEAQVLNDLGLYKGISTTEFVPDLGTALNRETGVVMLLRMFGLEADAEAVTDADATLAKFSDAASISSWAKNSVAYAVENGLVVGLPDGTFGPKAALNGKAYCTLILKQLGYTPDYDNAPAQLADKGGLTVSEAVKFTGKDLIKDDLVGISYGALKANYSDGTSVIGKLVDLGTVAEDAAVTAGLMDSQLTAKAEDAVKAYEAAPLTTLDEVTAAETLGTTASDAVALVTDETAKADLDARVTAQKAKVDAAKADLASVKATLEATGVKAMKVTFNQAVDTTKAKLTIKKNNVTTMNTTSVTFADDSKSATVALASKITAGDYTVSVTGLSDQAIVSDKVTLEDEKVAKIEFTSDTASLGRTALGALDATAVTVPFKLYNQYGEDVTNDRDSEVTYTSGSGTAAGVDGTCTISKAPATFSTGDKVAVSAIDSTSAAFATAVLTVADMAQVADASITSIYNEDSDTKLQDGAAGNLFDLVISAKDQYGNDVTTPALLNNDVVVTSSSPSYADVDRDGDNVAQFTTMDVNGDGTKELVLPLTGTLKAGTTKISIISKSTGKLNSYDVVVADPVKVDTFSMSTPDVAPAGEDVVIPFTAVSQYGDTLTKFSDLNATGAIASISPASVQLKPDYVHDCGQLVLNTNTTGNVIITVITGTNKISSLTVNVVDKAVATTIDSTKDYIKNFEEGGTTTIDTDNIVVKDQYGRDVTNLSLANAVKAAADAGLATPVTDYRISVASDNVDEVTIAGADAAADNSVAYIEASGDGNGVDFTADADTKGSANITIKLQKWDPAAVGGAKFVDVDNSDLAYNAKVVEKADIQSYELADISNLYEADAAGHSVDVTVNGILADGSKVVVPAADYTVYVNDTFVSYAAGKLSSTNDITVGDHVGGVDVVNYDGVDAYNWGDNTTRTVPVVVTVTGDSTASVLTKNVTVCKDAPAMTTLAQVTGDKATDESDGLESIALADLKALNDDGAGNAHEDAADILALAKDAIKTTDQYGVEMTGAAESFNAPICTNFSENSIGSLVKGDSFNMTVVTTNGKAITFKVAVK